MDDNVCVYRDTGVAVMAAGLYATHCGEGPSQNGKQSTGTAACTLLAGHRYGMLPTGYTAGVAVSPVCCKEEYYILVHQLMRKHKR